MADEYIRRDAAMKAVASQYGACRSPAQNRLLDEIRNKIRRMPAADVAEVVRCKNCKWFADNNGGEWYGCQMFQVVRITPEDAPKPDDFCSYGERKEDSPCES